MRAREAVPSVAPHRAILLRPRQGSWRRGGAVAWSAWLLVLSATACTEELPDAASVERVRPLGVKSIVSEAPSRAWPLAGEEAEVRWPLAFPGEAEAFSHAMLACPLAAGRYGLPTCDPSAPALPLTSCPEARPWEACGRLRVPSAREGEVLVLGLLCIGGQVRLDPGAEPPVRCEGGGLQEGLLARLSLWDGSGEPNRHPPPPEVRLGATPLPDPPAAWRTLATSPCPDVPALQTLPPRAPGQRPEGAPPHRFSMRLPADAAEPLSEPGEHEQLVAAHLVTAGRLQRRFGAPEPVASEGGELRWEVGYWAPPADEVPPGGLLVRLHVTVRDGRGGFVETMRAFCVRERP